MKIQISDHFTTKKLARFVLPSVVMMIFTSIYGVVDGYFVSNYAGKVPFEAVNIIFPLIMILGGTGFMIGTGGTAIVAKTLGEGDKKRANEYFSLLIYSTVVIGIILSLFGYIFVPKIARLMGAKGEVLHYAVIYARINFIGLTFFMLQNVFQSFLVTAEKPKMGLVITLIAGFANMIGDAILVPKFGVEGAAVATISSQILGGIIPIIYFLKRNNGGLLKLGRAVFSGKVLIKTCTNGCSELMNNISSSLVTMMYNLQLLKYVGDDGVASYGVIMYVLFVFISTFIGYSIGSAPLIAYNYGANNKEEMSNIYRKSIIFGIVAGMIMCISALILSKPLSKIFVGYDDDLYKLTVHAFRLYSIHFALCGVNIFASSFFTALNNGVVSAIISFMRTLVFQCASVMILPIFFGVDGIWNAVTVSEVGAFIVTFAFLIAKRKKYGYSFRIKKEKL